MYTSDIDLNDFNELVNRKTL